MTERVASRLPRAETPASARENDEPRGRGEAAAASGALSYQDLLQIVELVKASSHFSDFHLKVGDIEVRVSRNAPPSTGPLAQAPAAAPVAPAPVAQPVQASPQRQGQMGGGELVVVPPPPAPEAAPRHGAVSFPPDAILVKSPMVGTFYRAPEPGAPPFVEVGQEVAADTTVCIIEVMKLMNSIPAGSTGVVTHILVDDAQPVEYGQVLMVIEPKR